MSADTLRIREATPDDAEQVIHIWRESGLVRPWHDSAAEARAAIASPSAAVLIGSNDSGDIATVLAGFEGLRGWIYRLGVLPNHPRVGYGRQMAAAAEDWLREQGAPKVELLVRKANETGLAFWTSLGYRFEDSVVLGKRLDGKTHPLHR